MKNLTKFVFLTLLSFLFFGCPMTKEILPGFVLIKSPNDLDNPGKVFRITPKRKVEHRVETLNLKTLEGEISVPQMSGSKELSLGIVCEFLKINTEKFDAKLKSKLQNKYSIQISLIDAKKLVIEDKQLRGDVLANLKERIKSDIKEGLGSDKDKYYLLKEAVTAKEFTIEVSKENNLSNELALEINKVINVRPDLTWGNNKKTSLRVKLEKPQVLFFKPFEIKVRNNLGGDIDIEIVEMKDEDLNFIYENR